MYHSLYPGIGTHKNLVVVIYVEPLQCVNYGFLCTYGISPSVTVVLQVIVLCGNLPGLRSVYFVKVDTSVSNSLLDRIRHNVFGVPDALTFATFIICQSFNSDYSRTSCTNPSLGYRFDAQGMLGIVEDVIPEELHRTLSVAQGGIMIPSVVIAFAVLLWCLTRLCTRNDRLVCCIMILGLLALIFALASLAVQIVGYHAVRGALAKAEEAIPGQTVELVASLGPAVWLTVGAVIALIIVVVDFLFECIRCRRKQQLQRQQQPEQIEMGHV
ncbi:SUR7/PalI family-domain-containing protein [Zychaea mexicana]|uniref:SUR7/PalI family-domain-containing protein n=1 Tax=Zychaea mexicana TaxID=64656 RepID=UPI0022FE0C46|nr:SUR7/PalI family-domain-containing protein [Zychaea mexicana]KAI9498193.1 SUR7/PalI family-domain-containing protein [Zychaea mexicana]